MSQQLSTEKTAADRQIGQQLAEQRCWQSI